ncbi:MAG: 30S ribosomal protein S1, partial [Sporomusaceae bacterium]|nr:30S ribosomal protein S1 [Sporomusaceae bacterium]
KSIFQWTNQKAIIIETAADAEKISPERKLGVVAQTTFSSTTFQQIIGVLSGKCDDLNVKRTICTATDHRQEAALSLAGKVDTMVVVGGKNSANTSRLFQTCSNTGCRAFHIETAQEIDPEWFASATSVGITAGASTPDWIINEVYERIAAIMETKTAEINTTEPDTTEPNIPETGTPDTAGEIARHLRENDFAQMETGSIVSGKVVKVTHDEVFVDLGYKAEGVIPLSELAFPVPENAQTVVSVGDMIKAYVLKIEGQEGNVQLSKIKADTIDAWEKLEQALAAKTPLTGTVLAAVKGGVRVAVLGISGFVPASLLDLKFTEDLAAYAGEELTMIPIEIDRDKTKLVLSRKEFLLQEREAKEQEIFSRLKAGGKVQGKVSRITSFGAFVDLGGIDGLIHISDLAWQRPATVTDVVNTGDEVTAIVLNVDPQAKKIALSLKETAPDPWYTQAEEFTANSIVTGKVVKLANFGAFVKLPNGLEGLLHISEISDRHLSKPQEALTIGQEVVVKILKIEKETKRIALSITQAASDKEQNEFRQYQAATEKETTPTLGDKFAALFAQLKK